MFILAEWKINVWANGRSNVTLKIKIQFNILWNADK